MPKTLSLRLDDATYRLISEAAAADNRSISNFIETAARQKAAVDIFVTDEEMADLRGDRQLQSRLRKGHKDVIARRGRFV